MKNKIKLVTAVFAAAFIATGVRAQNAKTATMEVAYGAAVSANISTNADASAGESGFGNAVKQLEADLIKALDGFNRAGAPDAERVKDFDDIVKAIDNALKVTDDGGGLDQAINKAIGQQNDRIRRYETQMIDPNLGPDRRSKYEEFVKKAKDRQTAIANQRASVRRLRSQLQDARKSVEGSKQFYIDAIAEQELDA